MQAMQLPPAGLIRRLAALVYDSLILISIAMAYGALFLTVKYAIFHIALPNSGRATMGLFGFIGLLICLEAFYIYFWCRGGQTVGMKAWRIRLIESPHSQVSLRAALIRGVLGPLSLACAGIGYLWSLIDREKRCWHDMASGTQVVVLPKPSKKK